MAKLGVVMTIPKLRILTLCGIFLGCCAASGQGQGSPDACPESLQEIQLAAHKLQLELQTLERAAERIQRMAGPSERQLPAGMTPEQPSRDPTAWEEARRFYDQGKAAEDRKQCAQAVTNYTKALQIDPLSDAIFQHRGSCRYQMGDLAGALADLDECLRIQPNNGQAYRVRASIRKSLGRRQEAIADLTEVIRRDEANIEAVTMRAMLYYENNEDQRALSEYDRAVKMDSSVPRTYVERARVYRKLMDLPSAMRDCERARVRNSQSAEAHLCLAETQLAMREADRASDEVTEALRLDPNLPGAEAVLAAVRGLQRFEGLVKLTASVGQPGIDKPSALSRQVPTPELEKNVTRAPVIIIDGLDEGPREVPFYVAGKFDHR